MEYESCEKEQKQAMAQLVEEYTSQLEEKESRALTIAVTHLGSSFCIERSNGFLDWLKKRK